MDTINNYDCIQQPVPVHILLPLDILGEREESSTICWTGGCQTLGQIETVQELRAAEEDNSGLRLSQI